MGFGSSKCELLCEGLIWAEYKLCNSRSAHNLTKRKRKYKSIKKEKNTPKREKNTQLCV